jgi:hypothetical protein
MRCFFDSPLRTSAPLRIVSVCLLSSILTLAALVMPGLAADLRVVYEPRVVYAPPVEPFCAECIRDAIYADTRLIAHLEANPDVDEEVKGPIIVAARADVQNWRKVLGPGVRVSVTPCCYWRKRIYVR